MTLALTNLKHVFPPRVRKVEISVVQHLGVLLLAHVGHHLHGAGECPVPDNLTRTNNCASDLLHDITSHR